MAGRRRKPKIYDERCYTNFGEQPSPLEIQLGYGLIPLVDTEPNNSPLLEDITYVRNQIDGEYGLPLPSVHVRDNMCLEPYEYKIFLHGVEVGGYKKCDPHYVMCIDTGYVTEEISGEKIKDPIFGLDAVIIHESKHMEAYFQGYVTPEWHVVIKNHLYEIIRKNLTKFLDQSMVNKLVEKVRKINPDVITDVFITKRFSISDMKIVLNRLLEERVSIRDMNTILETIAEYLSEEKRPLVLAEKVRVRLAPGFIKEYSEDGKNLHVFRIAQYVSENLIEHIYYPESKIESPYLALDPVDRKKVTEGISKSLSWFLEHDKPPVFVCVSQLRPFLADYLHGDMPGVHVISDLELYAAKNLITVNLEGEVTFDD